MTIDEVLTFFEKYSSETRQKQLIADGVTQSCFGLSKKQLDTLMKQIKQDHDLGLQLWKSKYYEASLIASRMMDGSRLTEDDLNQMVEEINHYSVIDLFVRHVVSKSTEMNIVSKKWMNHSCFLVGRAGWMIEVEKLIQGMEPKSNYDGLLDEIKHKMKYAHPLKQELMNQFLVELAIRNQDYAQTSIDIATQIGPLSPHSNQKGSKLRYAPLWIEERRSNNE